MPALVEPRCSPSLEGKLVALVGDVIAIGVNYVPSVVPFISDANIGRILLLVPNSVAAADWPGLAEGDRMA